MPKRRSATWLLLALAAGGFVAWRSGNGKGAAEPARPWTEPAAPAALASSAKPLVYFSAEPPPAPVGSARATARTPVAFGAAAAALIAEQASLEALAKEADVELSPRQWQALARATLHIQQVRQAYEATIATVMRSEDGRCRVEIPAYPDAGDALRATFREELEAELGAGTAAEVQGALGRALEGRFAGFGVSVQTLEFVAENPPAENGYEVTRTVRYWNAVEGGDRLVTRRETHFPRLEDPAGDQWGPFLALLRPRFGAGPG